MKTTHVAIEGSATLDVSVSGISFRKGEPLPPDLPMRIYTQLQRMGVVTGGRVILKVEGGDESPIQLEQHPCETASD